MYVPSGLKTKDGKDIMCYTGAFYLKNKEQIEGYEENAGEYNLVDVNEFSREKLLKDNLITSKAILIEKSQNKEEKIEKL